MIPLILKKLVTFSQIFQGVGV